MPGITGSRRSGKSFRPTSTDYELPPDHPLSAQQFRGSRKFRRSPRSASGSEPAAAPRNGSRTAPCQRGRSAIARAADGPDDAQHRLRRSWEREADDPSFFYKFAADGYAFGINVVLYALSHWRRLNGKRTSARSPVSLDELQREHDGDPWHGSPLQGDSRGYRRDARQRATHPGRAIRSGNSSST